MWGNIGTLWGLCNKLIFQPLWWGKFMPTRLGENVGTTSGELRGDWERLCFRPQHGRGEGEGMCQNPLFLYIKQT